MKPAHEEETFMMVLSQVGSPGPDIDCALSESLKRQWHFSSLLPVSSSCRNLVSFRLLTSRFNWNELDLKGLEEFFSINTCASAQTAQLPAIDACENRVKMKAVAVGLITWKNQVFKTKRV